MKIILVTFLALLLTGCANMSNREQRVVSGAAIGGTLGCWPGAAIGAVGGLIVDVVKEDKE